jgi:rubrerythrin
MHVLFRGTVDKIQPSLYLAKVYDIDNIWNYRINLPKELTMKEATQKSLDTLSEGINAELSAYVFYKRAGTRVNNAELITLLNKLASEEKDHYWTLEAEYDSLVRSEKWVTYNDIMRKEALPEIPEEMTAAHRKRLELLEKTDDPHKIISIALELEEDARDFYQSQIVKVDDPAAASFYSFLTKFEQGHVNILTNWLKKI